MIRDMDLLRKIVLEIEMTDDIVNSHDDIRIPGVDSEEVAYHCLLLHDAGLIDVAGEPFYGGRRRNASLMIRRLTSQGHDFLDQIRSQDKWAVAKKLMAATRAVTLPILITKLTQMTSDGWDEYIGKIAEWVSNKF